MMHIKCLWHKAITITYYKLVVLRWAKNNNILSHCFFSSACNTYSCYIRISPGLLSPVGRLGCSMSLCTTGTSTIICPTSSVLVISWLLLTLRVILLLKVRILWILWVRCSLKLLCLLLNVLLLEWRLWCRYRRSWYCCTCWVLWWIVAWWVLLRCTRHVVLSPTSWGCSGSWWRRVIGVLRLWTSLWECWRLCTHQCLKTLDPFTRQKRRLVLVCWYIWIILREISCCTSLILRWWIWSRRSLGIAWICSIYILSGTTCTVTSRLTCWNL